MADKLRAAVPALGSGLVLIADAHAVEDMLNLLALRNAAAG